MKTTTTTESDLNKPSPSQPGWSWYKWEMLILLWVAFFLHQGCRQIYNSVIPLIKSELGLTNVQAGLVSSIFTLVYGILVPVAGIVGDRFPRKWVIVCSVAIFSGGILLTGFSSGLVMLVVFISVTTGGGEAFFYPSATSLLAQVHEKSRALALGLLQTGLYVGVVVSGLLAGWIGQNYGWRNSFLVFGGAGVFWTLVVIWRLRNTPPPMAAAGQVERLPIGQVIQYLVRRPSVWLLSLAFGAMVFVNVGFLTWTPAFLNERFNFSLAQAGFHSMAYHFAGAFLGVLLGSRIADHLVSRRPTIRMEMNLLGLLCGAPFIFWLGHSTNAPATFCALGVFGLFRGLYDSNLFASLYDVVEPRVRASATGLMLAFAFVIGSSAPAILGWMKTRAGLGAGLSMLCWFYLFGAACIFVAVKFFLHRDRVSTTPANA
ncbi:MAG: MFS transporter [Verrucomicrobiota bacterium]